MCHNGFGCTTILYGYHRDRKIKFLKICSEIINTFDRGAAYRRVTDQDWYSVAGRFVGGARSGSAAPWPVAGDWRYLHVDRPAGATGAVPELLAADWLGVCAVVRRGAGGPLHCA